VGAARAQRARPLTGRKTYVQKTVHGTKREAETELARFVTEVGDGAHASTKSTSVGELLEQWFSHNEADWSPTVVNSYRRIIDRQLIPRFGRTPLRRLTTADIDLFYAQLRKRGGASGRPLAPASVKRVHTGCAVHSRKRSSGACSRSTPQ
jgi:integrase-like protein